MQLAMRGAANIGKIETYLRCAGPEFSDSHRAHDLHAGEYLPMEFRLNHF